MILLSQERDEARQNLAEARLIFADLGDRLEYGHALHLLGRVKSDLQPEEAEEEMCEALAIMREVGNLAVAADLLWELAQISIFQGKREQGFNYFKELVSTSRELGSRILISSALGLESLEALRYSTLDHALRTRQESLRLALEVGDDHQTAWCLWEMGEVRRVAGEHHSARIYYEEAKVLFQHINNRWGLAFYNRGRGDLGLMENNYSGAKDYFLKHLTIAQTASDWSVVYALCGLGRAECGLGRFNEARRQFSRALKLAFMINSTDLTMIALTGFANLLAAEGENERALELATFVTNHNNTWNETRIQAEAVAMKAASKLTEEVGAAARSSGLSAVKEEVVDTLLSEFS
jgi:tetratricopeptide (TPR) repeat protein